ncbi:alpha-L-rhamnosidase-like protein [Gibbsiella quercinecans]|uniref:Sugar hydrolase n=1 Tax=Gibbsiella quercinecans TaxID=929813 RepID=A0A250B616_9GAMM|nr:family 78 glycoside hydrolase catalytic domain [Gibbsiella quercinecans]ATA21609.1 sugar hydrolase [Gibbsiella quercinecans]RLM06069.1 sugar hydrolase [Gibbsiella quercinecans]RLM06225.1 sugar hydrolase [Gibbsiella quercinecans]TCT88854.1 alpha-L-rhamnosidase-like protein [Gibbsiella quercinecans]
MSQGIQKNNDLIFNRNPHFLTTAAGLLPTLQQSCCLPVCLIHVAEDSSQILGWRTEMSGAISSLTQWELAPSDEIIIDFGTHCVGYLSLRCEAAGSPPDAPAHLQLIFGETPAEVAEPFSGYDGWLSSSWLQQEDVYLDVLPVQLRLPRRYCCRYVKIHVVSTSAKFNLRLSDIRLTTVTSADSTTLTHVHHPDALLGKIDQVSVLTLRNCMQEVFEDGPKRDRRLWLGDLRLQALVNYQTFGQNDLVKRCLYLFAGVTREDGMVSSNLFIKPEVIADDTFLLDYALFFVATLADYIAVTGDLATLDDLWPTAWRQIELALKLVKENGILRDSDNWWSFIDWHASLNKQAATQGVLIYCLKKADQLAERTDRGKTALLDLNIRRLETAAMRELWDEDKGFFISGSDGQISCASQVWLVLAGVGDEAFRSRLVANLLATQPEIGMNTPYMMHHFIDALISVGETERAVHEIKKYWGGMVQAGADTFWELYDPNRPDFSPYGSKLINSYCHAWSCTPAYFIRKYGL